MATYLVRRLLISIPTLFGITIIAFIALAIAPGDPLTASMDPDQLARMTVEQKADARHALGLDQPIPVRYVVWLSDVLQGDLGYSIVNRREVADDLTARLGPTLLLMGVSALLGVPIGVGLGLLAAVRQYSTPDYLATGFSTLFIAIPGFVVGLVLIYVLGANLKILPTSGMVTLGAGFDPVDLARHMVMPVALLGLAVAAQVARYTRTALLEVMGSEYIVTARSKGLRSRRSPVAPRLPERAHPHHHRRRPDPARPRGGRGHHRDPVRLAGHGPAGGQGGSRPRPVVDDGRRAGHRHRGAAGQHRRPTSPTPTPIRGCGWVSAPEAVVGRAGGPRPTTRDPVPACRSDASFGIGSPSPV